MPVTDLTKLSPCGFDMTCLEFMASLRIITSIEECVERTDLMKDRAIGSIMKDIRFQKSSPHFHEEEPPLSDFFPVSIRGLLNKIKYSPFYP
jgi:hypothetical protein